jgi:hypothetical protein
VRPCYLSLNIAEIRANEEPNFYLGVKVVMAWGQGVVEAVFCPYFRHLAPYLAFAICLPYSSPSSAIRYFANYQQQI